MAYGNSGSSGTISPLIALLLGQQQGPPQAAPAVSPLEEFLKSAQAPQPTPTPQGQGFPAFGLNRTTPTPSVTWNPGTAERQQIENAQRSQSQGSGQSAWDILQGLGRQSNPDAGKIIGPVDPNLNAPPASPSETALSALQELIMGGMGGGDSSAELQAAINEAGRAAGTQYGAQIGSIRRQNKRAKADTAEGADKVNAMYRKLAKSNKRAAGDEVAAAQGLADSLQASGQQEAETIRGELQSNLDANAAAGNVLGSKALTQALNSRAEATSGANTARIADQSGRDAKDALSQGNINREFFARSGQNARLEGTNRAAGMFDDLQDYLQGNRDKISELRGAGAAASAAARASASSQLAEQQQQSQQQTIGNLMNFLQLTNSMGQQQFDNDLALQKMQGQGNGFEDYLNMLPRGAQDSARISGVINQSPYADQINNIIKYMSDNTSMGTGYYDTPNGPAPLDNSRNMTDYLQDRIAREPNLGPDAWNNLPTDARQLALIWALTNVAKPNIPKELR